MKVSAIIGAALLLGACSGGQDQLALGARIYADHCASCHGPKLEGQPEWRTPRADGKLPAPPHDESGHTWHHSDRWLFHVVENGMAPPLVRQGYQSDMPAFRDKLSDAEIRAVLAYIKSQWSAEIHRKREAMLASRREESLNPGKALQRAREARP